MHIKIHPFDYKHQKTFKSKKVQCRGVQCTRVQTISLNNGQTKTIYHSDKSYKSGRTFAEIYWDSVLNSPNFTAYQNKFRKKNS